MIHALRLREAVSAGEPLNPEIIDCVQRVWGTLIRELLRSDRNYLSGRQLLRTKVKPSSIGRPLPRYKLAILDLNGKPAREGEINLPTAADPPAGLMSGYEIDGLIEPKGAYCSTKDMVAADTDGYFTFVGRTDDVFKSSDYRISPFEL